MKLTCTGCRYAVSRFKVKLCFFIILALVHPVILFAQTPDIPAVAEQQLENNAANNEEAAIEDDTYLQQLQQYKKHPLNLNTASENELQQLDILNVLQVQNLLGYRSLLGRFINIYELQAIPGWTIELIRQLLPYVSVNDEMEVLTALGKRLCGGGHSMLFMAGQTIERLKGFLVDPSATTNFYRGSPQKLLLRYKYQYKNLLQYGVVGEKDAGEQFFKGKQQRGFDFYSLHFFARGIGKIKALALGDFTVNLGQGLIQWQSLAFKKGADILNIKREAAILKPYNSAGEINFHRGAGVTVGKDKWAITCFLSFKKIDANLVMDTSHNQEEYISSLQTSGYHRTKNEVDDKAVQSQLVWGGNCSYKLKGLRLGFNGIWYRFGLPMNRSNEPYNLYAFSGRAFSNCSVDCSYTFKNMHLFGEVATSNNSYKAVVSGLMVSVAPAVDLAFLYRNIAKGYQSLYANAFTENTFPVNEAGLYSGISVHPGGPWRIDAYADIYRSPWLKFRVTAPSTGSDYLLQLMYKPNKQVELYSRFRSESKAVDANPSGLPLAPLQIQPKQNWRTQFTFNLSPQMVIASRIEITWFSSKTPAAEQGFLTYFNFLYKPFSKPWAAAMRFQYFETGGYNSRIYAFENDVMYSFSIPGFYDKGFRYYINTNYDVNKNAGIWIKWEQSFYTDKTLIGSGLDEIKGNKKSGVRIEFLYKF